MNQVVISLCRELAEEANAIITYTEDLAAIGGEDPETAALLTDIRLDELEHVQKLALGLSRVLIGEEDGEATDEAGGEDE